MEYIGGNKTEIIQIIDNLRRENLKKGKNIHTICKIQITRELKEFDKEIIKILDQIIGKESKNLRTHNLYVKLRKLKRMPKIITNTEVLYLLKSIEFQYVKEKKQLKSIMKNQQKSHQD